MDIVEQIVEEQQQKSVFGRGRITPEQHAMLKRKIGIPLNHPYPRCPARNLTKAKRMAECGDNSHIGAGHRCDECNCDNVAGLGTDHFGYGWCNKHEKGRRKALAKKFAENHLIALQQRNPAIMKNGEAYMQEISQEVSVAPTEFMVAPAASKVYSMLDSFYSLMSKWESDKASRDESVNALIELKKELNGIQIVDGELAGRILETLEEIERKLKFPMTERGGREMSTEVRMKLIAATLKDVVSAMKLMQDMSNVNSISAERFKTWLHKLHRTMVGEFGEQTYVTVDGKTERIMSGISATFVQTGEPSK